MPWIPCFVWANNSTQCVWFYYNIGTLFDCQDLDDWELFLFGFIPLEFILALLCKMNDHLGTHDWSDWKLGRELAPGLGPGPRPGQKGPLWWVVFYAYFCYSIYFSFLKVYFYIFRNTFFWTLLLESIALVYDGYLWYFSTGTTCQKNFLFTWKLDISLFVGFP